jgi:MFS family permease
MRKCNLNVCRYEIPAGDFDPAKREFFCSMQLDDGEPKLMRGISIKALLISNAAYFVVLFVSLGIGVAGFLLVVMASNPDISGSDAAAVLDSSGLNISIIFVSGSIASLAAGYIAGRIAKRDHVVNGVMAVSIPILFGLALDVAEMPTTWRPILFSIVMFIGSLILSAFGAHLTRLRQMRWDTMSTEERAARGFKYTALMVARWIVALPIGAAVFFISMNLAEITGALQIAGGFGAVVLLPAAIALAIVIATMTVPRSHRRIACLVFIAIAISVPMVELIRHSLRGNLSHGDGFMLFVTTVGAGLAYLRVGPAFNRHSGTAQRWWWLSTAGYAHWSRQERTTRMSLYMTALVTWLVVYLLMVGLGEAAGIELHLLAIVAGILSLPVAFGAARPIFARLSPNLLRQADENAIARLNAPPLGGSA